MVRSLSYGLASYTFAFAKQGIHARKKRQSHRKNDRTHKRGSDELFFPQHKLGISLKDVEINPTKIVPIGDLPMCHDPSSKSLVFFISFLAKED